MISLRWLDADAGPGRTVASGALLPLARLDSDAWREIDPDGPPHTEAELVSEVTSAPEHQRMLVLEARCDGEVAGFAHLVLTDLVGERELGWAKSVVVAPGWRRRGIGTALCGALIERCRAEGRMRLRSFLPEIHPGAAAFAASLGARPVGMTVVQSRVLARELDRDLLGGWVDRAQERASGYSIVRFDGSCPPEWLEQFAAVISVMNTAPRSAIEDVVHMSGSEVAEQKEAHLRRGGWARTVCAYHEESSRLVGFTELGGTVHRPVVAQQGDTAVDPAHRDRGIGRWVKALNALRLLDERPEVEAVETFNAEVNAPMRSINEAMGFRTVMEWEDWALDVGVA